MVKQSKFESNQLFNTEKAVTAEQLMPKKLTVPEAQESIYRLLLDRVKQCSPEITIQEFKHLFIQHTDSGNPDSIAAVYEIIFANNEEEFHYTIKRSCYILVNNWISTKNNHCTQQLIESFEDPIIERKSFSPTINRLRAWTRNFVNSKDYQELKLFISSKYKEPSRLSNRYKSHLLIAQSADIRNPIEQREAALNRAKQLQYRFKFDLAMYMAHLEPTKVNNQSKNPTELGDDALRIIKIIIAKQEPSSYARMADIFIQKTQKQPCKEFQQSLLSYLVPPSECRAFTDNLKLNLLKKLTFIYETNKDQIINERLLLKTCNKLISHLTTEDNRYPSPTLHLLMTHAHPLVVVIVLLKIVLISRSVRGHLESCIAVLIHFYEDSPQSESKWMVNFLEIFNIMFAIYADNMSLKLEQMLVESVNSRA